MYTECDANVAQVDERRIISKCFLYVVPLLFLTVLLTYLDRSNAALAGLQFRHDLHLTTAECKSKATLRSLFLVMLVIQGDSAELCTKRVH